MSSTALAESRSAARAWFKRGSSTPLTSAGNHRLRPRERCVIVAAATLLGFAPATFQAAAPAPPNTTTPHPFAAPLPGTPLAKPLVFNGGFGDYRIGHFHAGFDLGTGRKVGRPVLAPDAGWIERVRSSGVGYGRSTYL